MKINKMCRQPHLNRTLLPKKKNIFHMLEELKVYKETLPSVS